LNLYLRGCYLLHTVARRPLSGLFGNP
jgi:hypothetical protein